METVLQGRHPHLHNWQWESDVDHAIATQAIEQLGLGGYEARNVQTLSGGERQRAAVARALVGNPQVVLGDEPTGNLDERTADHVYGLMLDLNRALQTSLLLVTHDRGLAARMDRQCELHHGMLREVGG